MKKKFEGIIKNGKAAGKTYAEINIDLKAAGANFHLNPDGGVAGWTEQEMAEGFIEQPAKTEDVQRELDKTRRVDLKNKSDFQHFNGHTYEVFYNENGYVWKAKKVD